MTPKPFGDPSPAVPNPQWSVSHSSDSIGLHLRRDRGQNGVVLHAYCCKGCSSSSQWVSSHLPDCAHTHLSERLLRSFPRRLQRQVSRVGDTGRRQEKKFNPSWREKGGSCWQKAQRRRKGKAKCSLDRERLLRAKRVLQDKSWHRKKKPSTRQNLRCLLWSEYGNVSGKNSWEKQIMERDTRDLNHSLLRGKVAQAFKKRYLKEIEGRRRGRSWFSTKRQVKADEL